MQAILPRPDIAPLLQKDFVALAADADETEGPVHELIYKLRSASMLPLVLFADAEGRFLAGTAGLPEPAKLKELIEKAAAS